MRGKPSKWCLPAFWEWETDVDDGWFPISTTRKTQSKTSSCLHGREQKLEINIHISFRACNVKASPGLVHNKEFHPSLGGSDRGRGSEFSRERTRMKWKPVLSRSVVGNNKVQLGVSSDVSGQCQDGRDLPMTRVTAGAGRANKTKYSGTAEEWAAQAPTGWCCPYASERERWLLRVSHRDDIKCRHFIPKSGLPGGFTVQPGELFLPNFSGSPEQLLIILKCPDRDSIFGAIKPSW